MMNPLVIDSSVAIKWFVFEQYSLEADRILQEYRVGSWLFHAPDLIYGEVGNVMWKKQAFQGFDPADAERIISDFRTKIRISVSASADLLESGFRLAVAHRRAVYDSLYLALSLQLGCPFVTADEKLVNAIGPVYPNVIWLANWA
jgi:predicted nucleic acid-binding protein